MADVKSLLVPTACGFPSGTRLSDGEYTKYRGSDIVENAEATLREPAPLFTDLNDDGAKDGLVFLQCNQGRRIPGDLLLMVGPGGSVVGHVNLDAVFHQSQVRGTALSAEEDGVRLTASTMEDFHGRVAFSAGRLTVTPTPAPSPSSISLKGATFTSAGLGPLKIDRPASDYPGLINADAVYDDDVDGPRMPDGLHALINSTGTVTAVWTESSQFSSRKGARVGTSATELRRIYPGSALEPAIIGTQSADPALALKDDSGHGLYFLLDPATSSKVTAIYAAVTSEDGHIDHRAT